MGWPHSLNSPLYKGSNGGQVPLNRNNAEKTGQIWILVAVTCKLDILLYKFNDSFLSCAQLPAGTTSDDVIATYLSFFFLAHIHMLGFPLAKYQGEPGSTLMPIVSESLSSFCSYKHADIQFISCSLSCQKRVCGVP